MAIESLNIDARQYSGISMRKGGITAAVQAKIAPAILHLQSGHGTATSSMGYVIHPAPGWISGSCTVTRRARRSWEWGRKGPTRMVVVRK